MPKRTMLTSMISMMAFVLATNLSLAVITYVPYQGDLRDPEGNTVPDGSYTADFSIWDDEIGGEQLWSETQTIETSDGKFILYLGSMTSLSPDVFTDTDDNIERYLQIQIAGDEPMSPRILMGDAPTAFISARVLGDVITEPDKLVVGDMNDAQIAIAKTAEQEAGMSFLIGEGQTPVVDFQADASGGSMSLVAPNAMPVVDFLSDANGGSASFKGISTLNPEIRLNADDLGASLNLLLNEDAGTVHSASQWGAWSDLAAFRLADPRPSPDFIISTDAGGSKIEMGDIEGAGLIENLDLSVGANQSETWLSMYGTNDMPVVDFQADASGGSMSLVAPNAMPVVDFLADASGGSASFKGISTLNPEIRLNADDLGASLNLLLNEDAGTVHSASQWGAWSDLAAFRLADPRPSPDFIISTDAGGSKIEMGDIEGAGLIENLDLSIGANQSETWLSMYGSNDMPVVDFLANNIGGSLNLVSLNAGDAMLKAHNEGADLNLTCNSFNQPTLNLSTDCNGANIAFGIIGDVPVKPGIDIGIDGAGANIELSCDSDEQPRLNFNTDCNGANIAFGFIGDVPVKPGIDIGINDLSSYLSLLVGGEQQPVVDFLADASGGNMAVFEPNGIKRAELATGGLSIYDGEGVLAAVFEPNGVVAPKGNLGSNNTNTGTNAFVAGQNNLASGNYSSVLGGSSNSATGGSAVVCGGVGNSSSFGAAFVGGGQNNTASGLNAVVGGGNGNTASGDNAMVLGGNTNTAAGDYSFAGGLRSYANHQGSFVWADATGSSLSSDVANQIKVRASGGTYVYSNSDASTGVRLYSGSSQWQSISDRNAKRNIRPVDGQEILQQLQQLPVSRWSYKDQDENIEHIGPMAQDFYALFGIGEDDRHISMLDPAGVALAGVKALLEKIQRLEARIVELEAERR